MLISNENTEVHRISAHIIEVLSLSNTDKKASHLNKCKALTF